MAIEDNQYVYDSDALSRAPPGSRPPFIYQIAKSPVPNVFIWKHLTTKEWVALGSPPAQGVPFNQLPPPIQLYEQSPVTPLIAEQVGGAVLPALKTD